MPAMTKKDTRVLDRLIRQTPQRVDDALRGAATEIVGDIVTSFGTSPSPPGGPPGVKTGALRASMRWDKGDKPLTYYVMDGVIYGIYQEMGGVHSAKRPFVAPVFQEWKVRKFAQFLRDFGLFQP